MNELEKFIYAGFYYQINKHKIRDRKDAWYRNTKNKQKIKAWGIRSKIYSIGYRNKNKRKIKAWYKAWSNTLAGRLNKRVRQRNRYYKLKDLSIKIVQMVYENNIKKYGTLTCYLCLKPVAFKNDCIEHKTPLSRGGTNAYANLGVACRHCNARKHAKTVEEFKKCE